MLFRFIKIVPALPLLLGFYGFDAAQAEVQHKTEVQEPCWTSTTSPANDLLSRRVSLGSSPESLFALMSRIQIQGVPLSFIDSLAGEVFTAQTKEQSVRILLRDLIERFPVYRCQVIGGRVVLFPKTEDRRYEATVDGVKIEGVPRYPAARQLVQHLNESVAGLHDLVEPPLAGIAEAPIYTEPVSLVQSGTVLEHLVHLLGKNPKAFFVITKAKSGLPFLLLGNVP